MSFIIKNFYNMKHLRKIIAWILLITSIVFVSLFFQEKKDWKILFWHFYKMTQSFYNAVDAQLCMVDYMWGNIKSAYQCEKYIKKSFEDYKLYMEFFPSESDYEYLWTK